MSSFIKAYKNNDKSDALSKITHIQTNLDYLEKLFWSSGGGKNVSATNKFRMYKADIERDLNSINKYLTKDDQS